MTGSIASDDSIEALLHAARHAAQVGESDSARTHYARALGRYPGCAEAAIALAHADMVRGHVEAARQRLQACREHAPLDEALATELAILERGADRSGQACAVLEQQVAQQPDSPVAWLLLGELQEQAGQVDDALWSRFEAVTRSQLGGRWHDVATTPPHLVQPVLHAIDQLRRHRRALYRGVLRRHQHRHGEAAMQRIALTLAGYLREVDTTPADPQQRPRFLHVPDLPAAPFLDPYLQPWATQLQSAWTTVRDEALAALADDQAGQPSGFEDFIQVKPGDRVEHYLGGTNPAWEAYFFYRHGERYDEHHARCPRTSALLESIDLCRIPLHAPEICFSLLTPGTHLLPHHGVTNARVVMHLPLVVPPDCALHLPGHGRHTWREGELMMFDDTYLHEAWNRSDRGRLILLMDCWNPHLTLPEREALTELILVISRLHRAGRTAPAAAA